MSLYLKNTFLGFLAMLFLVTLFAGLGRWQLNRADEKTEILEAYRARAKEPAVALPSELDDPVTWRSRKVHVTTTPLTERQFLLDNQIRGGRVGFNVLTPFNLPGGGLLLVDRGWVALGASRKILPDVSIPNETMRLEGLIYVPYGKSFSLGGMDENELRWPRVIQFLDFAILEQRLGAPLRPFILRLDPALEHGYRRDWQITAISPDKHLAYAFQWFALAGTALVIFLVLSLKRRK